METLSFYSYKGGAGRSLLVANVARFLALSGKKVVVVDLDLEAPGLLYKLQTDGALERAAEGKLRGVVDYLLVAWEEGRPPAELSAFSVQVPTPPKVGGSIQLMPAGSAPHPSYFENLARLDQMRRDHDAEGGLLLPLLDLSARIELDLGADFLLIDSRTGVTELGGLATTALADRVICVTLPTRECMDGTNAVIRALEQTPRPPERSPRTTEVIVSRVGKALPKDLPPGVDGTHVLHHDDEGLAQEQRIGELHLTQRRSGLLVETVAWCEGAFPALAAKGVSAAKRMRAVDEVLARLMYMPSRPTPSHDDGDAWRENQVKSGVHIVGRFADLALFVDPDSKKPDLVIEYVGAADPKAAAQWWLESAGVSAACMLVEGQDRSNAKLFTRKDGDTNASARWDLPHPGDFGAFRDVGDASVAALCHAVRGRHSRYVYRLLVEWVHATHSTLHGGAPWRPALAREILDAMVAVDDSGKKDDYTIDRIISILGGDWLCDEHWGMMTSGRDIAEQVAVDLLAPFWWRTELRPALRSVRDRRHGTQISAVHEALATRMLGLRYEPDAEFRRAAPVPRDDARRSTTTQDDDASVYLSREGFEGLELRHELDAIPSDRLADWLAKGSNVPGKRAAETAGPAAVVRALRNESVLATVGVLGSYDPHTSTLRFYRQWIHEAARQLELKERHLERVVHMHLAVLAYAHLGRDGDGRMWEAFALPHQIGAVIQPGTDLTTVAQYFVWRFLKRLDDDDLMHAFTTLSAVQPPAYQHWEALRHVPIEDVRAWLLAMRRGTETAGAARFVMLAHRHGSAKPSPPRS